MKIIVNGTYEFDLPSGLTVKEGKLYNTKTKQYEAVEGDIVSLIGEVDGKKKRLIRGPIDGFTNGSYAKIRGINVEYNNIVEKEIDHISHIKIVDESEDLERIMSEI